MLPTSYSPSYPIFSDEYFFPVDNTSFEEEDVSDTEDSNAYGFGSNNPSSPITYLEDINSNELNSPHLEECSDSFEAISSKPVNDLKRKRESDILSPLKPFETDLNKLNLKSSQNVTSDSVSSGLESTIGRVKTIKLTCLTSKCKRPLLKNSNNEESLCNRCWVIKNKNSEFSKRSSARLREAAEKTVQKMKATNFGSRGLQPTIGKIESIKQTCLSPNCKNPSSINFNKEENLCNPCWVLKEHSKYRPHELLDKSVQKMKAANKVCKNDHCGDPLPTKFMVLSGYCSRCTRYNHRNGSLPEIFRRKFKVN